MSLTILNGDCAKLMQDMDAGSIQMACTSPPYDKLRTCYSHDFDFPAIASCLFRVICDGGVLCWNVADQVINGSESLTSFKQAIHFVEQTGFRLHDTMIYEKSNFSAPESNRYHNGFEYVFVLSKGSPRTFNPIVDRRNIWAGKTAFGQNTKRLPDGSMEQIRQTLPYTEFGMRTNVWKGNTRGQEDVCQKLPHPAMMPKWLVKDLILSFSNPGDTVLDPMAGSFTVPSQAIQLGRNAVGIEIDPEYCKLADQYCNVTPGLPL